MRECVVGVSSQPREASTNSQQQYIRELIQDYSNYPVVDDTDVVTLSTVIHNQFTKRPKAEQQCHLMTNLVMSSLLVGGLAPLQLANGNWNLQVND